MIPSAEMENRSKNCQKTVRKRPVCPWSFWSFVPEFPGHGFNGYLSYDELKTKDPRKKNPGNMVQSTENKYSS
jgi:hypothetical protein